MRVGLCVHMVRRGLWTRISAAVLHGRDGNDKRRLSSLGGKAVLNCLPWEL